MIHLVRLAARFIGRSATRAQTQLSLPFDTPRLSLVPCVPARSAASQAAGGTARRNFWIRHDPHDCRRAVIGGSFAEVCAALDRLAAQEACAQQ